MVRSGGVGALIFVFTLVGSYGFGGTRTRHQGAEQAPPANGRISGQVIAADNGAPVRRAQITITGGTMLRSPVTVSSSQLAGVEAGIAGGVAGGIVGGIPASPPPPGQASASTGLPPGIVRRQTETDDAGRFEFADLPLGHFSVAVTPPTGFVRPDRMESVDLTDAQPASLTIRLVRGGAITGRVLDESGEPLARINVRAMRRDGSTGGRLTSAAGEGVSATTDDLGHFRLYGLSQGDYYVWAYTGSPPSSAASQGLSSGVRVAYAQAFYPGSFRADGARSVQVLSGQDTGGIDFAMPRVAMGRVLGTAVDSQGHPLTNRPDGAHASVMIALQGEPNSGRGAVMRLDGRFEFSNVAPGDYDLVASLLFGAQPNAERESAFTRVTVNGNDVTVSLQTNAGATLSGRVIVEDNEGGAASRASNGNTPRPSQLTVSVLPDRNQSPLIVPSTRSAQVAADGSFELRGLRGSLFLVPAGGRSVLKGVFRGSQDLTAKPLTFRGTERVTDVTLVMTTDTAVVQGTVTDDAGRPAPRAWVVVFPDDPERWFSGSPFVSISRTIERVPALAPDVSSVMRGQRAPAWTPTGGAFVFPALLPGRYWLAAVRESEPMPMTDRESLDKLRAGATSVALTAGEPTTIQLRLMK